jgi:hypothetical protein
MLIHNLIWLSGVALFALLFAANAVRAEQESDGRAAGLGRQVADLTCATSRDGAESRLCEGARLRWRLCEQGFRSERFPNAEVYGCFLRSN